MKKGEERLGVAVGSGEKVCRGVERGVVKGSGAVRRAKVGEGVMRDEKGRGTAWGGSWQRGGVRSGRWLRLKWREEAAVGVRARMWFKRALFDRI